ncbi:hypothetical protein HXX01_00720 [Candidatus Nomurabacteria bacterium]|nr:hypothetical protein [Candidatus Nomurabacteria bacterium]
MHKFLSFIKEFRFPKKQELKDALTSFSKKEYYLFLSILVVAFVSMFVILNNLNNKFLVDVPVSGGAITEGIIGMPTLINPVLAISDADKDMTSLIYSGLMRRDADGNFINDLASSHNVSTDGLIYTFVIKDNATFHDGKKITADDIIFTVNKIKDSAIKSPKRTAWEGISVEKADDKTVVFKLKQPYISFLDNMTTGILPSHIWKNIEDSQFGISPFNVKAIGSGPYKFSSVTKNKDGIPEKYVLKRFTNFTLGVPHIKNITIVSYANEKELLGAIQSGAIDQASGISPVNADSLKSNYRVIHTAATPRILGIFYNSLNNKIFADANVVKAFNYALNKQEIVDKVLYGYGTVVESPVPLTIIPSNNEKQDTSTDFIKKANDLLEKSGWTMKEDGFRSKGGTTTVTKTKKVGKKTITEKVKVNNGPLVPLAFSLTTGDSKELRYATEIIKTEFEKIGAKVDIQKVYEMGPLNQVIRDREYEALFFGQIINQESHLYSFWHSSQRKAPGLNISMYNNVKVDKILEEAQKTMDQEERISKYKDLVLEFNKDLPALLIYSPQFLYVTSSDLNNININN